MIASTLLKAPGGKFSARKLLHRFAPWDYDEYREPFAYSASMATMVPNDKTIRLADIDPHIFGFWQRFKSDDAFGNRLLEIADEWKAIPLDRLDVAGRLYEDARQRYHGDGCLESFWVLSRASMGAVVSNRNSNFSPQWLLQRNVFRPITADLIRAWRGLIGRSDLCHADYRELLHRPGRRVWLFLDPPYIQTHPMYGHTFTEADHRDLVAELDRCPHKFMATVGPTEKPIYEGHGWMIRPRVYPLRVFHNARKQALPRWLPRGTARDYIITNY